MVQVKDDTSSTSCSNAAKERSPFSTTLLRYFKKQQRRSHNRLPHPPAPLRTAFCLNPRPSRLCRRLQYWGDHFNSPLRDMLEEACSSRDVADCEFFINKRDYPQLKFNPDSLKPVEPYGFIYDKDDR